MKLTSRCLTLIALFPFLTGIARAEFAAARGFPAAGPGGGSITTSESKKGNKVTASATATGAQGKTATASGTATVYPGKITVSGSSAGPNGGTASGNATASNGTVNGTATVTGKNGQTGSGSVTATSGTATFSNGSGASKTVTRPGTRTAP